MPEIPVNDKQNADLAAKNGDLQGVMSFLGTYSGHPHFGAPWYAEAGCDWSKGIEFNARQLIKHKHWFDSWEAYAEFQEQLKNDPLLVRFEQTVDAIMTGDLQVLGQLLTDSPELISMRSPRNHHATLLNYVGANGVEEWRQKTPENAVAIAELLLAAGAEVDARGDMYRGTTTLGQVATSVHPVRTGVQEPLMDVLIRYGADLNHAVAPDYTEGMLILACIHNGRYEPIHYLARHGAEVDLEGACALGDLDKVRQLYDLSPGKRIIGLTWACVYGHRAVVDHLLEQGVPVNVQVDGTTPLLCAAFGGQLDLVKSLLERGADMEAVNDHGGTALGQTLWCLYNDRKPAHLALMELFIARGAKIQPGWLPYIEEQRKQAAEQYGT